jgi:transposase
VALAALKGDKTLAQVSRAFGVPPKQIQAWKKRRLAEAPAILSTRRSHADRDAEELQAEGDRQIGRLKVALDWVTKSGGTGHDGTNAPGLSQRIRRFRFSGQVTSSD